MAGKGPVRYRRTAYRGNGASTPPGWHRPAKNYLPGEVYLSLKMLCGYSIDGLRAHDRSTAVKPAGGKLCAICERKAAASA